ncbi:MAG: hypothetical protein ACLQLG_02755, partial [Thermoguttaceae bacterium]
MQIEARKFIKGLYFSAVMYDRPNGSTTKYTKHTKEDNKNGRKELNKPNPSSFPFVFFVYFVVSPLPD